MASGKPIIACLNGEGGDVVQQACCGWSVQAGDAAALANLVVELSTKEKSYLLEKGAKGLDYYNAYFEKEKCLRKLDKIMGLA